MHKPLMTMPRGWVSLLALTFATLSALQAEVKLTELPDRVRVEIDGKLFTEYRHKAWFAPYLYPVIGPNGQPITRPVPENEEENKAEKESKIDHPHHRSIRFSHRGVNGFSFWAPQSMEGGHLAEIKLDKIEKMTSGEKGEFILWNNWTGDGKLVLREKQRYTFIPVGDGQVIMDFDVELHPAGEPATFVDQKDGGLSVRVVPSMNADGKNGATGTIVNSAGLKNDEAWGKRAEWCDFHGQDASGKVVGVAIFDHPKNLRYPTTWHARPYGLLAANRFGTGSFEKDKGAKPGDGEYTIPGDGVLLLRHRLFIHHGDAATAKVAERYAEYAKDGAQ